MTKQTRISPPPPKARTVEARARRALQMWIDAGLEPGGMEILNDGSVRIIAPESMKVLSSPTNDGENTCDDIFGTTSE